MAAAVETAEGFLASRSGRALSFACSFTICLMAAGALAITLFGRPHAPAIMMDLHAPASARASAPAPAQTGDGPVMGRVTQPIYAGKALLADPALVENTAEGPLPRIADDGRKPMNVYAGTAPAGGKFKIAIVVNGLGLSAIATKAALDALPGNVTLGFTPYGADAGKWVSDARARGHEVLLQVPMDPTPCAPARKRKPTSSA